LGSAQVVGKKPAKEYKTGTAILTTIVSPGFHAVTAVYGGTAVSPKVVRSKPVALKITGNTTSAAVLTAKANAKNPKNYDFTASVSGFGLAAPTKTADFTDITANTDMGTAALDPKTVSHGFGKALVTNASSAPAQSVVADLNGDGFPDIATANAGFGPSTVAVFLGKGDGTFEAVREFNTTQSQGYEVTIADLNGNVAPDLISSDVHASIGVLLNVTAAKAKLSDVVVPGTSRDVEEIIGQYSGDSRYAGSKSAPIKVKGSSTANP
jgi:hypothetical protein